MPTLPALLLLPCGSASPSSLALSLPKRCLVATTNPQPLCPRRGFTLPSTLRTRVGFSVLLSGSFYDLSLSRVVQVSFCCAFDLHHFFFVSFYLEIISNIQTFPKIIVFSSTLHPASTYYCSQSYSTESKTRIYYASVLYCIDIQILSVVPPLPFNALSSVLMTVIRHRGEPGGD